MMDRWRTGFRFLGENVVRKSRKIPALPGRLQKRRQGAMQGCGAVVQKLEQRLLFSTVSAAASDVLTYHGNSASTGLDSNETVLTPTDVNATDFNQSFLTNLDGQVYAQPLTMANVNITIGTNPGIHDVIFAATMNDSLYAVDANTGVILWQDSFLQIANPQVTTIGSPSPTSGVTTYPAVSGNDALVNTTDVGPELGILATPVINASTNILYLVTNTQEVRSDGYHYVQRLWALNISNGSVAITPTNPSVEPASGGQVIGDVLKTDITSTDKTFNNYTNYEYIAGPYVKGTGDNGTFGAGGDSSPRDGWIVNPNDTTTPWGAAGETPTQAGYVAFNALLQMGRTSLSLINGVIYMGFASHGDDGPYYGWILGYNASNLSNVAAFVTAPTYEPVGVVSGDDGSSDAQAGLWMGGDTITTDGTYLYLSTGNGAFNVNSSNFNSTYVSQDTGPAGTTNVELPLDNDYGNAVLKLQFDPSATQSNINLASGSDNPNGAYTPDSGYDANGYGLKVVDYFVPSNALYMNDKDEDLGSGGIMLVPSTVTSDVPGHVGDPMLVTAGKEGRIYLIDQDNLGGFNYNYPSGSTSSPTIGPDPSTYDRVLGEYSINGVDNQTNMGFATASFFSVGASGTPVFFDSLMKLPNWEFNLSSFQAAQSPPGSASTSTPNEATTNNMGSRGATSTISSNGTSNAIVWVLNVSLSGQDALNAYTIGLGAPIYTSNQNPNDSIVTNLHGTGVKFSVPTVFNGMVYLGTGGGSGSGGYTLGTIDGYGLNLTYLDSNSAYFSAPTGLSGSYVLKSGMQLTWNNNSSLANVFEIDRSTNGSNWSVLTYVANGSTGYLDSTASQTGTYYYRVRAVSGANVTAYSNTLEILPTPAVANEYMFYYGSSAFDGSATSPTSLDQNAIAQNANGTDKTALLPGGTATFSNVSSYINGINGILIDFANEPAGVTFSASDFQFNVGNNSTPSGWAAGPAPSAVATWTGTNGDTFADIVWPNGTIRDEWLQVTVKADANTHLAANDVFYFGSLVAATGASVTTTSTGQVLQVTSADVEQTEFNLSEQSTVPISDLYDFDRNGQVTSTDVEYAEFNLTEQSGLELINLGSPGPTVASAPAKGGGTQAAAAMPSATSATVFSDSPIDDSSSSTPSLLQQKTDLLQRIRPPHK